MYSFTLADAANDRLVFGSDLGAGYPYTDLVYGVPDVNGQLLYAGIFQGENIGTVKWNWILITQKFLMWTLKIEFGVVCSVFLESYGLEWPTNNGPLSLYVKQ
jgi:hypothetical protein